MVKPPPPFNSYSAWLANNGETATAIQQLLGHKSITTTQRYVHHDINSKRSAAVRAFSGIGKKKVAK
jgi:site-specific recombinase XerD